jgi:hypothetical protein
MSDSNGNTVIALKSAFLRAQIRTLSQPLQVPDQWLDDRGELPLGMVEDVLRHGTLSCIQFCSDNTSNGIYAQGVQNVWNVRSVHGVCN